MAVANVLWALTGAVVGGAVAIGAMRSMADADMAAPVDLGELTVADASDDAEAPPTPAEMETMTAEAEAPEATEAGEGVPVVDAAAPPTLAELEAMSVEDARAALGAMTMSEVDALPEEAVRRIMEGEGVAEPEAQPTNVECEAAPEPAWAEALDTKRSLLVRELYEARSYEAILAAGDCPCELRKPSWAAVEAEYQADYAAANADTVDEADAEFRRLAASLRRDARAVCEPQGTW